MSNKVNDSEVKERGLSFWVGVIATLLLVLVLNWILAGLQGHDTTERGQFGDTFGFANAIFSGIAIALLIWTVHLQREDLKLQRRDLGLTKEALDGQRKEMAATAEAMKVSRRSRVLSSFNGGLGSFGTC